MDIYKIKFTVLQQEILRFLFVKAYSSFTERGLGKQLGVSPTAVSNSIKLLEKEQLVSVSKDKESRRLAISLNKKNPEVFALKRIENLGLIHTSGIVPYLSDIFPGATIILFGSYSFGEDSVNSDIDIAIIGSKEKYFALAKFEKILERPIRLQFYTNLGSINKNLRENVLNGIVLSGGVRL